MTAGRCVPPLGAQEKSRAVDLSKRLLGEFILLAIVRKPVVSVLFPQ
jgi:hypothetical protein